MKLILLNDILIIFGLAVLVLFICHRFGVSTIVGFLLTGVLAGPHGFGFVKAVEAIEILAEVGVVLLLFTIGLEFSLRNLVRIRRVALLGGGTQVGLTCLFTILLSRAYGLSTVPAVFMGFLVSLSSTAIVMKIFQDRAEVESPHGNTALGILIFQDIIVVPMMLFLPVLAGVRESWGDSFLIFLAEGIGIGIFVLICAKWVVPWILYRVTQTRIHELFLLSVILICLLIAWLTHLIGLSLALGAFLAGLIISESEYSHQAIGNILPFRDVFTSFFFVSIGMLLNLGFFVNQAPIILGITLAVFVLKFILAGFSTILAGLSLRTAILTGMALCQVGEFSFILSKTGLELGVIQQNAYQMFLAVSVITMAFTPFAIGGAPSVAEWILRWPLPQRLKRGAYPIGVPGWVRPQNHIIIVGFGINGRNIARAAKTVSIPYVVIEMNPQAVRAERGKGEPIHYGDATQEPVLKHAGIQNARAIVIVINDPTAGRRITRLARVLNPKIHIVVRTRFLREMEALHQLGANEVIPEEFETSVEIFARVLRRYLLPREEIERFISEIRSEEYEMFRSLSKEAASCLDLTHCLPDVEIGVFRVVRGSPMAGKSLIQAELPKKYGVTLLAIRRNSHLIYNPRAEERMEENDLLVLIGEPEKISGAAKLFRGEEEGKDIPYG